jgi:hypothetical protein
VGIAIPPDKRCEALARQVNGEFICLWLPIHGLAASTTDPLPTGPGAAESVAAQTLQAEPQDANTTQASSIAMRLLRLVRVVQLVPYALRSIG